MFDSLPQTERIRRPGLLLRAAMAGQRDYDRDQVLRRLFKGMIPTPSRAARLLAEAEAEAEVQRRASDAAYSVTRHVTLLIALFAEQRLATTCLAI